MSKSEKLKKLRKLAKKVSEKSGGKLTIASDLEDKFTLLSTPFSTVNNLIGGIPRGRFTTIAGPEHVGKGAFSLQTIAHLQSKDPEFVALWTDAESALDLDWAKELGVDLDRLIVQRYTRERKTMEALLQDGLDLVEKSEALDLWVIDSIGALIPQGDAKKTLEGENMLHLQRKLGEFFRKTNILIAPTSSYPGCAVVMIGQVYSVPTQTGVGLTEVRGGNALKHWAHLRLAFRRGPKVDWPKKVKLLCPDGQLRELHPGWSGRIRIEKTRINQNESKEILLGFYLGRGFDSVEATVNAAFGLGIITRSGPYYYYASFEGGKVQGRESVFQFFKDHEEVYVKLFEKVNTSALEEYISKEELDLKEEELL